MGDVHDPDPRGKRPFAQTLADRLAELQIHELPPTHRAILIAIALHAGPDGRGAYPSINRIRAITGFSLSVIVAGLRDLSDIADEPPNWMGRVKRYNPETGAATSTSYDMRLDGRRWPKSEAKAKRKAMSKLPPGGKRRTPLAAGHNEAPDSTLCLTQAPPVSDTSPPCRVTQAPPVSDTTDQPSKSPSEKPIKSPYVALKRSDDGPKQVPLIDLSEDKATARHAPKAGKRPKRSPSEPKAEDLYAAAYIAGHADVGFPMTALNSSERGMLSLIAPAHARYRDKTPIIGADLVAWFRRRARDFREDMPDVTHHPGKYSPFGFSRWLDGGSDGEAPPLAPGQKEPARPPPQIRPAPNHGQVPIERIRARLEQHGVPVPANFEEELAHGHG